MAFAEESDERSALQSSPNNKPSAAELTRRDALLMFDYQYISIPDNAPIDLLGYHLMTPLNDWLYFGLGSYAPVTQGEYGGFMAFGALLHAQRQLTGNFFVNGGLSFGGGGGGRSVAQSVDLSGTGGYTKAYVGLGYNFEKLSIGANVSRMTFYESAIDSTQANVFVQLPFPFRTGPYEKAGQRFEFDRSVNGDDDIDNRGERMISVGLDNYFQIDPTGSYKGDINAADIQFSSFIANRTYWYYAVGVGYYGRPTYNQVLGGLGMRIPISERINLYGQLGIGSGGYAPSVIDTGSGLLVYPKLFAEYKLNRDLGVALTAGYLFAPDGTSRNLTFGAALITHFPSAGSLGSGQTVYGSYQGYRFSFANETKVNMQIRDSDQDSLNMLTFQADRIVSENMYIPFRAAIAYESYRTFPGYGEITVGAGFQSAYSEEKNFQYFGDVQVGANVDGAIARAGVGLNYRLNQDLALRGFVSQTIGQDSFRSTNIELGLTFLFSVPRF